MSPYVNPANAITVARFATLWPFWVYVESGQYQHATLMAILCGLGDMIDGKVARLFNCQSGFGEVLDAIADGVCYGFFVVVLAYFGWVPWLPVVAILALGGFNSVLRAIYAKRVGRTTNYRSFAMERMTVYAAYLAGFGVARFEVDFYYYSFVVLMAVIVLHDFKRMILDPVPT